MGMGSGTAGSVAELRTLSDDDLIHLHDEQARHTVVGVSYYLEELARRDAARQAEALVDVSQRLERASAESGQRLERVTWVLVWLTVAIAALTLVNVAVTIALYLKG